jgi:hypothetical protein
MKKTFLFVLAALTAHAASAEQSCARQLGVQPAAALVAQCVKVSPATHPPCNAVNSCAMVVGEIERGCNLLEGESYAPAFCKVADTRKGTLRATGVLMPSGGGDDAYLRIMTADGVQRGGFCPAGSGCDAWFAEGAEGEPPVVLDKKLRGRRAEIEFATEPNRGRIEGADAGEVLTFVKRAKLVE